MDYTQFLKKIKSGFDLQAYGLEEAFEAFRTRCTSCLDVVENEPFEWVDNNENKVEIPVTITTTPTDFEDGEPVEWKYEYSTSLHFLKKFELWEHSDEDSFSILVPANDIEKGAFINDKFIKEDDENEFMDHDYRYMFWNGSYHKELFRPEYDYQGVTVFDDYTDLDEVYGTEHYTGCKFEHARFHKVESVFGNVPTSEQEFLIVCTSQWVDKYNYAKLVSKQELIEFISENHGLKVLEKYNF